MEEFNFLTPVYLYRLSIDGDKIHTSSETKLLETQEEIDEYIRHGTTQSSIFTDDYLYIKKCSFKPDDVELVKEMKMELLKMYNRYLEHLTDELEEAKRRRLNLFKYELRLLKLDRLIEDEEDD